MFFCHVEYVCLVGCSCACVRSSRWCLQKGGCVVVWRVSHFCNNYAIVLSQHLCYFASSKGRQTIPPLVDWFYENWKSKANPEAVWLFPAYSYCCCTHFIVRVLFYEMKPFPLFLLQREAKRLFLYRSISLSSLSFDVSFSWMQIYEDYSCSASVWRTFCGVCEWKGKQKVSENDPDVYIMWIKFVFLCKKIASRLENTK